MRCGISACKGVLRGSNETQNGLKINISGFDFLPVISAPLIIYFFFFSNIGLCEKETKQIMPPIKRILPYLISAVTSFQAMPLEKWHFMQRKKPHGSLFFVLCTINIPSLVPSLTSFSRNSVKLFWEDPSRNWFGYMRWRKNCTQRVICLLKAFFFFFLQRGSRVYDFRW